MKMGKKVREYKSGDFIFAKVKGYPAWPARVQRMNGKKYFVYFYGTGETANLPPNMIFDYAENKDKFLTKTQKRRDFNDGVKQIEHDFANNVPLEQVIGVPMEVPAEPANETLDSALGETFDDSAADTTANDTTLNDNDQTANVTQNDAAVEDSDDAGNLVIDEGKTPAKGKKSAAKPKETPKKEVKTRGKKKEDVKEDDSEKKDEEVVSRSGRKIKPKRYMDEDTEENASLPSPAPKKRRGASPVEKEKEKEKGKNEVNFTQFNAVKQSELEGLKAPFKPVDEEKDNIIIAYLQSGTYVGIRLFQSRPTSFKNEQSKLQWDKQAASNAITLKYQLERDQITPESVQGQLVMDLNLTDEEKVTLDKERETEEKKARVQFLKTEMKLIELDAKIKTCLCLEKADTELCLTLLDELLGMEVRPLMLLKHPTCLETVKRMRAYVGNTPSWDLNEKEALLFSKQAHKIRKKADSLYQIMKELFSTPDGLSFWEYFSERVVVFKKATAHLNPSELLEMVHEPLEMTQPSAHTMSAAIEEANKVPQDDEPKKKKGTPAKAKKAATPSKPKRQSRRHIEEDTQKETEQSETDDGKKLEETQMEVDEITEQTTKETENAPEEAAGDAAESKVEENTQKTPEIEQNSTESSEQPENTETENAEKNTETSKESEKSNEKAKKDKKANDKIVEEKTKEEDEGSKEDKKQSASKDKTSKDKKLAKDSPKDAEKNGKEGKEEQSNDKEDKESSGEPRAKRSREIKKTEPPPPRSPAKRKSKF